VVGRNSHVPLYVQIRTHFLELIQSGKLRPYDRVPSESELSKAFSVSRMTARKAIDQLVVDELIFRRPGKGTFVAPPPIAHRISTGQSFAAAMRALRLEHRVRVLQAGIVLPPAEVAAALLLGADTQTVFVQRLRIVQGSPVAIHSAYLVPGCRAILHHDLTGSLTEILTLIGRPVDHTRDTVEAVVASDQEARLLEIPRGAPLARVDGIGFSTTDAPVFYADGLYRGDWFRFTVDSSAPPDVLPGSRRDGGNGDVEQEGFLQRHQHITTSQPRTDEDR
jgi:GntR family transcriptional regulator